MSKKDYIAIANKMQGTEPAQNERERRHQWTDDLVALADLFQADNPRFLRQRWFDYVTGKCGPNGGKR